MKEIRDILQEIEGLAGGERAVLATVVDLQGSGYRRPGARMLIKANGDSFGTVSGGCLEADVMERAKRVLQSGRSEVFVYDTTADEDSVFSLNMGCRGVLRILLEPVDNDCEIVKALRRARNERVRSISAVIIGGDDQVAVGTRFFDTDSLEKFPQAAAEMSRIRVSEQGHETARYKNDGSSAELAFETLKPPVQVLLLGAGADAVPLAAAAHALGWQVRVHDHRPAFLNRERFAEADELIRVDRDATVELAADELTAIVVMNHNYERDKASLFSALHSDAFYVGALGPKKRTQQILDELNDEFDVSRMRSPAGLDIGADTPEAIAIAIIAEIQCVLKSRDGGPLRERNAPIYDRK
ncbi:MAG: XdhC family protein [Acidobacteriota bacterium]